MSEVDWSKAPADATHYSPKSENCTPLWAKNETGKWFYQDLAGRAGWYLGVPPRPNEKYVPRSEHRWTGAGLPPVGADVECTFAVEMHEIWHRGTVVYCATAPEGYQFVVVDTGEVSACYRADGTCLRPYRTPEQIAADERESHINAMLCHDALGGTRRGLAEALHDAGYRKVTQ